MFAQRLMDNTFRGIWCEYMVAEALGPDCKLEKLTIEMDRPQLTPEDIAKLKEAQKAAADAK